MIITSLLDTDLYKFTMMQVVLHQFPGAQVKYRFKCRTPNVNLSELIDDIRQEIDELCTLRFSDNELNYLRSLRFIKSDFVDFLGLFQLNPKYVSLTASTDNPEEIDLTIEGPWLHTILFEIPILAIISELYSKQHFPEPNREEAENRLFAKIHMIKQDADLAKLTFADYGTRRRFSKAWHEEVIKTLAEHLPDNFVGTSNVFFASKLSLIPLGTMAHEYLQACQALGPRLLDSQRFGFDVWSQEYRGDLGIALSDVYGLKPFLKDFDLFFCKLFDGARHDSGDPFDWAKAMIAHYKKNRIDPTAKSLVFSDGLNFPSMIKLYKAFHDKAKISFGIGTNLVNDLGYPALQMVIKMVRCNNQPVAKLSDTPEKNMCDDVGYCNYLRQVFMND